MAFYLLQENGFKITLENGTGFLLLEQGAVGRLRRRVAKGWQRIWFG